MRPLPLPLLATLSLLAPSLLGQTITWTQPQGQGPSARRSYGLAYDGTRQQAVLFGGVTGIWSSLDSTWLWDGNTWTQAAPAVHPSARHSHAMAFDSVRQRTVLFGGFVNQNGGNLDETWEWDGANWSQIATSNHPLARHAHAMAFDGTSGTVLLFGGYDGNGASGNALDDTWTWNGSTWTQLSPATIPPARHSHAMVFDSTRQRIVMFGGFAQASASHLADTWEWNGTDWTQVTSATSPSPRRAHAMTFDANRDRTVLFGGLDGQHLGDNWQWDGTAWTQLTAIASPSARHAAGMVYCDHQQITVLFGGLQGSGVNLADTWTTASSTASAQAYGNGCGTPQLTFTPDAVAGRPIIGQLTKARIANAPTLAAGVAMGWSNTFSFPIFLPFDLAGVGMPGCDLLQSNEVFGFVASPVSATELDFAFTIPLQASLVGGPVYIQAYAFAPGANTAQVLTSNGIEWLLGDS